MSGSPWGQKIIFVRPEYVLTSLFLLANAFALEHLGIYGRVYPIKEENLLEKLKRATILKADYAQIEDKLREVARVDLNLPTAKALKVYEEEVTYTAPEDLKIGEKVIIRKGERINVLERIQLTKVYVFLDDYMIKDFLGFAKKYPTTFLITKGNVLEVKEKYPDLMIYMALPLIVERLKVKAVPTVVYQSGTKLVRVEIPWVEGKALLPF